MWCCVDWFARHLAFVNEDNGVRSPPLSVKLSALDEIKLFDDYFQLVDSRHKMPLRNIEYAIKILLSFFPREKILFLSPFISSKSCFFI